MAIEIQIRIESKRGCGYRKPGGIYLVGPPTGQACCRLPWPLHICPTCGHGIKPGRGWQWVDCEKLFVDKDQAPVTCQKTLDLAANGESWASALNQAIQQCPLAHPVSLGRAGLLWIGEAFYKTPEEFLSEARNQGISRRISTVPNGFKLGKTWVLLAHRKAITITNSDESLDKHPGIFSIFKPSAVEYVTRGDETQDELERIVKRGLVPVEVNPRRAYR